MKVISESRTYSSKVLLFGEYTALLDGDILATPLSHYHSFWEKKTTSSSELLLRGLSNCIEYLIENKDTLILPIDLEALQATVSDGYFLNSTIPLGYGLGSSASLVAAIADQFMHEKVSNEILKQGLAQMEECFHSVSSGVDPLVTFLNQTVRINNEKISVINHRPTALDSMFLLDSKIERTTKAGVSWFLEEMENESFQFLVARDLIRLNNSIIAAFVENEKEEVKTLFKELSTLQLGIFEKLIPSSIYHIWEAGLASDTFYMKLCGAGGGGFFMGYQCEKNLPIQDFPIIKIR